MNQIWTVLLCLLLFSNASLGADTNSTSNSVNSPKSINREELFRAAESVRTDCIQGRRIICGKIVKIVPGGLIVESGYTNLLRHPLDTSWLIPKTVEAKREPALVEKSEPDSVCVGLVYLSDFPKSRRAKPRLYDYVVIEGFPAGLFSYDSVGTVQRTVRHFSANLAIAVRIDFQNAAH